MDETPAIEVRTIEPEEYEAAAELIKANLGEYDAYDFDADISDLDPDRMGDIYDEPRGRFWIAVSDGMVVGTLALQRRDERLCHFKRLSIHSDFRRHDVGRLLMAQAEQWARDNGYRRAIAQTAARQKPAMVFLQSGGFTEFKRTLQGKQVMVSFEKTL